MKKISGKPRCFLFLSDISNRKQAKTFRCKHGKTKKKKFLNGVRYQKGPLFLCWSQELCHLTRNLSQIERTKKMFLQLLSNWQNGNYFNSKWQLEWNRFRAFAQLVTTVIFFSAWDKSHNVTVIWILLEEMKTTLAMLWLLHGLTLPPLDTQHLQTQDIIGHQFIQTSHLNYNFGIYLDLIHLCKQMENWWKEWGYGTKWWVVVIKHLK